MQELDLLRADPIRQNLPAPIRQQRIAPTRQGLIEDCHLREPLLFYNTDHGDVENSAPALCFDDSAGCMDPRPMARAGSCLRTRHHQRARCLTTPTLRT
ncbi:MAG: hypothetical protein K6T87_01090 [Roseiflexus sp.]|nr:hypothetical protein [Roseiflexus sp.]